MPILMCGVAGVLRLCVEKEQRCSDNSSGDFDIRGEEGTGSSVVVRENESEKSDCVAQLK